MAIPYVNATLTQVAGVGTSPDYDDPGTAGTSKWTGTAGIYVAEEIVEAISPGQVDEIKKTRLEIPYAVGRLVVRGDTLSYSYEGANTTRIAGTITRAPLVDRVRVLVEDA